MTATEHHAAATPAAGVATAPSSTSGPAISSASASARTLDGPPRTRVRARAELTDSSLLMRGNVEPGSADAAAIVDLLHDEREASRRYARKLLSLAGFWVDRDDPDLADDREERSLAVAIALRTTTDAAVSRISDAHIAVTQMPRTFERLAAGEMPQEWHSRTLRAVRDLTPFQRSQLDEQIAAWDLASIPVDRFRDELRQLVAWFECRTPRTRPEDTRDVSLEGNGRDDGTACLRITGPIPEILGLARRLDAAARAVQGDQRRAVENDAPIPFDLDGEVARDGSAMSLAELRYAILQRTMLDTAGVEVPAPRHRVNVVIPVLTLMGLDDTPATYDGITPLPAEMARALAAAEPVWHRIFTNPIVGSYLPVPAEKYRPTAEMVEHLRLQNPRCAVPGCPRPTTDDAENDHIEEFDHVHPSRGGPTSLDNLQRLHWGHHDLKTAKRIDPTREPDGTTTWTVGSPPLITTRVAPARDLATPRLAKVLTESWVHHQWLVDMDEMERSGELDRLLDEWGPVDPEVELTDEERRLEELKKSPPPF
ncbi:HNH endonuclease signature motif containing protein [Brachybacterium massiliense]|uniref:HNH endonuclease signature motif containing protein n=1 Tax=Brachybacterium massiliense TaxID=1755098 RepID=UPI000B3BC63A|nr:HNH endonuclease signature motif containing protein [Brachybacterium massiliense]